MLRILETTNNYFNYGDTLLENIIFTEWARGKFSDWILSFTSMIVRFHVVSILCAWFTYNYWIINFILYISISLVCTFYRHYFYYFIATVFEKQSIHIVNYLLDNYTIQNYRLWKRYILLGLCIYSIIICMIVEITSQVLVYYIIEYMITFIIVDVVENKAINKLVDDYKNRPRHIIHASFNIDEDYISVPGSPKQLEKSKSIGTFSIMMIDDYKT